MNAEGNCTECNSGYYITDMAECKALPGNCSAADTAGVCQKCNLAFELNPDGSNTCILLPVGCSATTGNSSCQNCVPGWTFDNAMNCVQLPPGCATGDIGGPCTSCLPGYYEV